MRIQTVLILGAVALAACENRGGGGEGGSSDVRGEITVDGSSTVYPITEAMAEEFGIETGGGVSVTVAFSGTGGGFKRFCAGETDISNASREISESEKQLCAAAGVEWLEIPVAIDGLTLVVHPSNDFVQCLTVAEVKRVWEPSSTVKRWSEVRDGFPNQPITLYGAGTNSGTFDYFTEAVMGHVGAIRDDFTASEDDNVLVQGVSGDANALGFFGYAYYAENQDRLKALAVDNGSGCVNPTPETILGGTYTPLSRPLYIYVKRAALEQPAVREFVTFYITHAEQLVPQVGYVPYPSAKYQENLSALGSGTGT
jgi:phosphate transport system substrate-binding protein